MHGANVGRFLPPRCVDQRFIRLALTHVFRVSHEADNLDLTLVVVEADVLAKHVFVGKKLVLESLIDDGYRGSVRVVLRGELPSPQERDFHRGEIVFADHLPHSFVLRRGGDCFARQQEIVKPIVVRDELDARERCRAHLRHLVQTLEELLVQPQQPFIFVTSLRRLQPEEQQVFLVETEPHILQIVERADKQSGPGQ